MRCDSHGRTRLPRLNLTEEETRALIVAQGRRLFVDVGYDKTTVADIARVCGFSTANVHRVFGTKAKINEAIAETMLSEQIARAEAAIASAETASERLEEMIRAVHDATVRNFTKDCKIHDMVTVAIEERWEPVRRYRMNLLRLIDQIVAEGVETGEFVVPDAHRAALGVSMACKRLFHPVVVAELLGEEKEGDVEVMTEMLLRSLGARLGGEPD